MMINIPIINEANGLFGERWAELVGSIVDAMAYLI